MRKSFYLVCSVVVLFQLFALSCTHLEAENVGQAVEIASVQDTVAVDDLVLDQLNGVFSLNGKPFQGVAVSFYSHGLKSIAATYRMGKKHGRYKKWFPNGTMSYECTYEKGRKNGLARSWWKNGQLRSEANFSKGVAHGEQLQWYKSGAKFKRIQLVNGVEEGLQQSWRENGKLYSNYEAKNGRIFGLKRANLCYSLDDEAILYKN